MIMMKISNRLLNEVSAFMKEGGYDRIARKVLDPIIIATAEKKQVNAVIEDDAIVSDILFILGKMEKNDGYMVSKHLRTMRKKVKDPETKGRRKTIVAA